MQKRKILITGGAGFIGSNLADHFIRAGDDVIVYDNLYRKGVEKNIKWLEENHHENLTFLKGDVTNYSEISRACEGVNVVFHVAGQTAVTSSVTDPREDLEINLMGTFNTLEAARLFGANPVFFYTSTNKVYGGMEDVQIMEGTDRYSFKNRNYGIDEEQVLDFHSPYGCSKGAADQYVRDYFRIYGMRTVVFRMSSIYGPHQFGVEDQAWVAYFVIAAVKGWPITIYGDGKQARDILYIDDLVRAFEFALAKIDTTAGQIYNMGGGLSKTISIWKEFAPLLSDVLDTQLPAPLYGDWRPGDQRVYISDIRKAKRDFGWEPMISIDEGLKNLAGWVIENREIFQKH